jgi:hypothetical protein
VQSIESLHSKIREGDVLKYVDGDTVADCTSTQVLSVISSGISSRASNPMRYLEFDRDEELEV